VGKRNRKRKTVETVDYTDEEGNVLTLRRTDASVPEIRHTTEDEWQRSGEMRFERLAVRWVISGLEYEKQKELLARYRMADRPMREWVQRTIDRHVDAE
jgi:hypothetical protein